MTDKTRDSGSQPRTLYVKATLSSPDLWITIGVILAALLFISTDDMSAGGKTALIATGGMAIGLLGVVLAAMTLLATNLDPLYRRVLDNAPGGYRGAMFPFKLVAVLAGLAILLALVGTFTWKAGSDQSHAAISLATFGAATWAVVGTVHLLFLTSWHGEQRARLLDVVQTARRQARARARGDELRSETGRQ
jgi:hypothetical protein